MDVQFSDHIPDLMKLSDPELQTYIARSEKSDELVLFLETVCKNHEWGRAHPDLVTTVISRLIAAQEDVCQVVAEALGALGEDYQAHLLSTKDREAGAAAGVLASRNLLQSGPHNRSPLHQAAAGGNWLTVKALLDSGAEINAVDEEGRTPLLHALLQGDEQVAAYLLTRGPDLSHVDHAGRGALHFAALSGNPRLIGLVLDKGAALEGKTSKGRTALHLAFSKGDPLVAKALLDRGANLGAVDKDGRTPYHLAAMNNHPQLLELGLGRHYTARSKVAEGIVSYATLGFAHWGYHLRQHLFAPEYVNTSDKHGQTPFHLAAQFGSVECAKLLYSHRARIWERDRYGLDVLSTAILHRNWNVVNYFGDYGGDSAGALSVASRIWETEETVRQVLHRATPEQIALLTMDLDNMPTWLRDEITRQIPLMVRSGQRPRDLDAIEGGVRRIAQMNDGELSENIGLLSTYEVVSAWLDPQTRQRVLQCAQNLSEMQLNQMVNSESIADSVVLELLRHLPPERIATVASLLPESRYHLLDEFISPAAEFLISKQEQVKAGVDRLKASVEQFKPENGAEGYNALQAELLDLSTLVGRLLQNSRGIGLAGSRLPEKTRADCANFGKSLRQAFDELEGLKHTLAQKNTPIEITDEDEDVTVLLPGMGVQTYLEYRDKLGIQGPELANMGMSTGADLAVLGVGTRITTEVAELIAGIERQQGPYGGEFNERLAMLADSLSLNLETLNQIILLPVVNDGSDQIQQSDEQLLDHAAAVSLAHRNRETLKEVYRTLEAAQQELVLAGGEQDRGRLVVALRAVSKAEQDRRLALLRTYLHQIGGGEWWQQHAEEPLSKLPKELTSDPVRLFNLKAF